MAELETGRGDSDGSVGEQDMLTGRVLPLNSKHLTVHHLRWLSEALGLPTTGSTDQMRQLKLRSDYGRETGHVQVVVKECSLIEATLALVDEGEQFLVTDRQTRPGDEELKSVLEENAALKDKLTGVQVELAQEQETVEALREELTKCKEQESGDLDSEVESLKLQLREQVKKSKHMWRLQCMQAQKQEDLIARQQREIQHLKGASAQSESPP